MNEIKYEAVFGPQYLFKLPETEIIVVGPRGDKTESNIDLMIGNTQDGYVIVAMRRIIKTPVWTVVDQKAGRLPEVGCLAEHVKSHYKVEILAIRNGYLVVLLCGSETQEPVVVPIDAFLQYYQPIETPAEKAQRLRSEWVNTALGSSEKHEYFTEDEYCRTELRLCYIYDALLFGELKAPGVE